MTESYFTYCVLPMIMGAKWGKAIFSPAASLISLGQKESLHMHVLEGEGGTVVQIHKHGHEDA